MKSKAEAHKCRLAARGVSFTIDEKTEQITHVVNEEDFKGTYYRIDHTKIPSVQYSPGFNAGRINKSGRTEEEAGIAFRKIHCPLCLEDLSKAKD